MNRLETHWYKKLSERKDNGNFRKLLPKAVGIDFYSNDYLGLTRNHHFQESLLEVAMNVKFSLTGSTGSRLISGNSNNAEDVETFIALQHGVEAALLFPSGYKANLALFSCIMHRHDTIIVDELIHRSVIDGCSLSNAKKLKFRHNDLDHLEQVLKKTNGNVLIAIESLYSMEGDFAPLKSILLIAQKYNAEVIVDEAHAIGVFGKGLVHQQKLQKQVLATIVTYGKAFGVQGAAVLGSNLLKDYLINFASPFIYSTAMPDYQVLGIKKAYQFVLQNDCLRNQLHKNIHYFNRNNLKTISNDLSPIKALLFDSTENLKQLVNSLKNENVLSYAVFSPTVKKGNERLRICLHAFNSKEEIDLITKTIKKYL